MHWSLRLLLGSDRHHLGYISLARAIHMAISESGTPNVPRMGETFVNSLVTTKGFILSFSDFLVIVIPLKWEFQRISKKPIITQK